MNSQRYPQGQQNTQSRRALRQLTLSMLIFGTIGLCRRYIPLPSDVIAFGRGLMGGVFLLLFARLRGKKLAWAAIGRRDLLLIISAVGSLPLVRGSAIMIQKKKYNWFYIAQTVVFALMLIFSIAGMVSDTYSSFLYSQF